jgi:8-oxo-dGTP pyrophosphatase MutT (NUDIX family)
MSEHNFSRKYVLDILRLYDKYNPHEKITEHIGVKKLKQSKQSFISRKNFYGHITASTIVLDGSLSKILLVYHNNIKKYLQPGGHIDETDEIFWQSAHRELKEETGITDVSFVPINKKIPDMPFDIDIHTIPENIKKREPAHTHIDFRYLFILENNNKEYKIKEDEVSNIIWKSIEEFACMDLDKNRVAQKIKKNYF